MNNTDVIVIGAGPAGMIAAGFAAKRGLSVKLLDKNGFPGRKLNITGKGRCNITNDCDRDTFIKNIVSNPKFMYGAVSKFSPQDVMNFFEEIGLPLKTERGQRVFPAGDNAKDVTFALNNWLNSLGIYVQKANVSSIVIENDEIVSCFCGKEKLTANSYVIATGGLSYPATGSTGDGYRLAESAGHSIITPVPSLVHLMSPDGNIFRMQGLSLRNVCVSIFNESCKKTWESEPGEMLFTHFGVSGPLILSASAHWKLGDCLVVDLKPGLTFEMLNNRLLREFSCNKEFQNVLPSLLHKTMIPVILDLCKIDPHKKVNSITKSERLGLIELLKNFRIQISGLGDIEQAVITRGGVSVKEIDPNNMRSKIIKNLYFAGEIIDIDAYTGGFNLQIAWSTGYSCGMNI